MSHDDHNDGESERSLTDGPETAPRDDDGEGGEGGAGARKSGKEPAGSLGDVKGLRKSLMEDPSFLELDSILERPGREWSRAERRTVVNFLMKHSDYFELEARIAGAAVLNHDPGEVFGQETWSQFL